MENEKENVVALKKEDLDAILASRDANFSKQLEEERKKLQEEFAKEKEKLKLDIQKEVESKTKSMASIDDLDGLVSSINGVSSSNKILNKLTIVPTEIIVEGELISRTECEIFCGHKTTPTRLLLTLDLVAKKPEFRKQFAQHYRDLVKKYGTDLNYSDEINNALISRGVINKKVFKSLSRAFLLDLMAVYGEQSLIVVQIVKSHNQLTTTKK